MAPSKYLNCLAAASLGLGLIAAPNAWAGATYEVRPASMTLAPVGSGANNSFEVFSTGDEPVAVEIHVVERQVDIDGNETQPSAEDNFIVYPPQILLQPGESQTVRVSWLGEPDPESELAYRIITEQLPVQLSEQSLNPTNVTVSITALFRYVSSLYITPDNAKPSLILESASHQNENGQDELVLVFNNQGTTHQLLTDLNLVLAAGGQTVQLTPEQLTGVSGENILAQHQRRFIVPWPSNLPIGPVNGEFTIQAEAN